MSMNAWRSAQLALEQLERLRLDQARAEARALCETCDHEISNLKDPRIQQLAREGLQRIAREIKLIAAQIEQAPDESLQKSRSAHQELTAVIAKANAQANRWSEEQATSRAAIERGRTRLQAARQTVNQAGNELLNQANEHLAQANRRHWDGGYLEVLAICQQVDALIDQSAQASLDETIRRQVVGSVITALKNNGFVVEDPQIVKPESDGGVVVLNGRLPSGKTARFEVQLDGHLHYDLNGYEGRGCAAEVERIEQTLQEQFKVRLGPPQVTWKNPDKISKGARDLPSGSTQRKTR